MRTVRSISLHFQSETSDKLYEVDLCEGDPGEFIVNFRYGRRGTALREGTKTTFPVDRAKAEQIFDKLVASKVAKGYVEQGSVSEPTGAVPPPPLPESPTDAPTAPTPAQTRLLATLAAAARGEATDRSISRIAWRAGEIRLPGAEPHLLALLQQPDHDPMTQLCLAWAAGRCGVTDAIPTLAQLAHGRSGAAHGRMAEEALLALGGPVERMTERRRAWADADESALFECVSAALLDENGDQGAVRDLYLLAASDERARRVLLRILPRIPLRPPTFQAVRQVLKAAEFRDDHEVYGLLLHRIETSLHHCHSVWGQYYHVQGRWIKRDEALAGDVPQIGYTQRTRDYLRRRAIRSLRRYGEIEDTNFINYAMALLLPFDEARDATPPESKVRHHYDWRSRASSTSTTHWDRDSRYWIPNWILYANSPRYADGGTRWKCVNDYRPGDPAPAAREEAFPHLWDRAPEALMDLLSLSAYAPVHGFAARAFRDQARATELVDVPRLVAWLGKPFPETTQLALDLAVQIYDPAKPQTELVAALLQAGLPAARQQATRWIEARASLADEADVLLAMLLNPHADVQDWTRDRLLGRPLDPALLHRLVTDIAAAAPTASPGALRHAALIAELDPDAVQSIPVEPLLRLIAAESVEAQLLGARLLAVNRHPVENLPPTTLESLLASESPEIRAVGLALFARLPERSLLDRADEIAGFCLSPHPEVRTAARPIVARLASRRDFAQDLVGTLLPILLKPESQEGLHDDVLALLKGDLFAEVQRLEEDHVFRLLDAETSAAQELGAELLRTQVDLARLDMRRLVQLGDHDIAAVREQVRDCFRDNVSRVRYEKEGAIRLLEATWEDSKSFAFDFFREQFTENDWSPDLLITVCDSVDERVQAFGTEQITRCFEERDGGTYLTKLSQHPAERLQIFASNYLDRFAADNLKRLQSLELYFVTVLSKVNRGRVAKDRAFAFLAREAAKNENAARFVAHLLHRQAATCARGDQAQCIVILRDIGDRWPALDLPLRRMPVEVRT